MLAGADVAVALAGGAELTQATSDIVLTGERLEVLAPAREIASETLATLRQNHRWALVYNLAAMPLAALGLVHPWLAAAGMSASSIAVVLNSLRIGCRRERAPTVEPGADAPTGRGGMNALVIMIPLSLALVAGAVWAFFWAVDNDQFEDLETPGLPSGRHELTAGR